MPQIAPNTWKVAESFNWFRRYRDGMVEYHFDPEDGHVTKWGEDTPDGIVRCGWLPMTPDLAAKIRSHGEFGLPVSVPPVSIDIKPGEVLELWRDCEVIHGIEVTCKACGVKFRAVELPKVCPKCKAEADWKPFTFVPAAWESAVYAIGIEGRYLLKMTPHGITVE